jgi:Zinc knuckle
MPKRNSPEASTHNGKQCNALRNSRRGGRSRCFQCEQRDHFAHDCPSRDSEQLGSTLVNDQPATIRRPFIDVPACHENGITCSNSVPSVDQSVVRTVGITKRRSKLPDANLLVTHTPAVAGPILDAASKACDGVAESLPSGPADTHSKPSINNE